MATRELIGRVTDYSGNPQVKTDIWLSRPGVGTAKTTTSEDGSFTLSLGDEFTEGSYRLDALPTTAALGAGREVELPESGPPEPVALSVQSREAVSARAGWAFMLATIAVLALCTWGYLGLHTFTKNKDGSLSSGPTVEQLSPDLSNLLKVALEQAERVSADLAAPPQATDAPKADDDLEGLKNSIENLQRTAVEPREPFFWSKRPWLLLEVFSNIRFSS